MNEEREINLLEMLLVACLKWRCIVIISVIIAVLAGGVAAAKYAIRISGPEEVKKLQADYEAEVAAWKEEGSQINNDISSAERSLAEQQEYNDNSWMMEINPKEQWVGALNLYIDTNYQIMPGSSVQNENPAKRICYAYSDYTTPDSFYDEIIKENELDFAKTTYLRELAKVEVSETRCSIKVSVVADTEERCKSLLSLFESAIRKRFDFINTTIGEHTLTASDISVYSMVNPELEKMQDDNRGKVNSLTAELGSLQSKLAEWEKKEKSITVPVVTVAGVFKKSIKFFIIGGIAACLVLGMFFCAKYVLAQRVYGEEAFDKDVRSLGELPENKKTTKGFDALIMRCFDVKVNRSEYEQRVKIIAMHAAKLAEESEASGNGKTALVSDIDENELEELAKEMAGTNEKIYAAGNILSDYQSAVESTEASNVIIVVKCRESRRENITQMIKQLKDRKTKVLGVMFVNVIAR